MCYALSDGVTHPKIVYDSLLLKLDMGCSETA